MRFRGVAADAQRVARAHGEPLPVSLAARHHAITSRGENDLTCSSLDEQARCHQSKATQPARYKMSGVSFEHGRCHYLTYGSRLRNNDRLCPQEGFALHAMYMAETTVEEECLPLPPT